MEAKYFTCGIPGSKPDSNVCFPYRSTVFASRPIMCEHAACCWGPSCMNVERELMM